MRIATWNLDHASNGSRPIDLQIEQIKKIDPDIIVLTETCENVDLTESGYKASLLSEKNIYGKYWSSIWSKFPIVNQIANKLGTYDPETAACAEIETDNGNIIVYGTIITWCGDPGPDTDNKSPYWLEHHRSIFDHGDDWNKLIRKNEKNLPFFVCGDFNQTRDKSNAYCSKGGQNILMLDEQLKRNNLICLTEENFGETSKLSPDPNKGYPRNNIDHICVSKDSVKIINVGAWDHFANSGIYLSDHNGVYVDFMFKV